jgi:hypothetical protein
MILQDELDIPSVRRTVVSRWRSLPRLSAAPRNVIVFACFFALVVVLQVASGAYRSEFGGYPDEPAHYVTSLMVHDYITGLDWFSPMRFAQDYYHHYPKVALGHWPPLFYVIQAVWMTLFSASRASVLLELALTTALLAYSVFLEAGRWFNATAGVLAGFLTICLPLVQTYSDEEMSETLLVLTCFWSAIYFARYIESERWQDSLGFGLFFSLAVLTKGSGWLLVLIPPVALLLTRKLQLLWRPSFWLSAAVVGALCVPWQVFSMRLVERGWAGGSSPSVSYTANALGEFLVLTVGILGPILSCVALIGIVRCVFTLAVRRRVDAGAAVMLALLLADWIFHSVVPAGVEDRKMIIAVPALVLFLFAGAYWLAELLPLGGNMLKWRRSLVAVSAALCFALQGFAVPQQRHYGYIETAQFITSDPQLRNATILVSSESGGEGMLVSEIAMHAPRPTDVIIRGTKALARVDWNASDYQSFFSTPEEVMQYFKQHNVQLAVIDTFPPDGVFLHDELVKKAIQKSGLFRLIGTFPKGVSAASGHIEVYRFTPLPNS